MKRLLAIIALVLSLAGCGTSDFGATTTTPSKPGPAASNSPVSDASPGDAAGWAAAHVDDIEEGADIMSDIQSAAGDYDVTGLSSACSDLQDWAARMQSTEPIPYEPANTPWQAALDDAANAADACVAGADDLDPDALAESASYIESFGTNIEAATEAIGG